MKLGGCRRVMGVGQFCAEGAMRVRAHPLSACDSAAWVQRECAPFAKVATVHILLATHAVFYLVQIHCVFPN